MTTHVPYAPKTLTDTLHRHFVSLMCYDHGEEALKQNGGLPAVYNFSGFVVELGSDWLVITAGHIFDGLKQAVKGGAKLTNWSVDDSAVSTAPQPPIPIPLDIDADVFFLHDEVPGMDYAALVLPKLACRALVEQGIVPVRQPEWSTEGLEGFNTWLLVGVPFQTTKMAFGAPQIEKYIATIKVDRLTERPEGFLDTEFSRLYAKIDFSSIGDNGPTITDIEGMSGGPIFGLRGTPDNFEYRLIGVQSSWNGKGSRDTIAMCAAQPFIDALRRCSPACD
ncbi:hypothetical protein [Burkholderia gladioli]|uniref:hypothetical protein n=1 Tax=Burkholderia gladioli TaxID=28095 RepID=UPI001259F663|nr:hypothetical protein [Burkholderia gladioli]KAA0090997.1 hypothetical protein CIW54_02110 [Paraburkholderia sp. T12-10]